MSRADLNLDRPDDYDGACEICGQSMRITHHLLGTNWRPVRAHDYCINKFYSVTRSKAPREIPERFQTFNPQKADQRAMRLAEAFSPQSKVKTLAILGTPGKGKSRILWAAVIQFFDELGGTAWVESFGFESLMTEYDKLALNRIAKARFVLVDDIGCIMSYGKERAGLQAALRSRIKSGKWTFITVDDMGFDPGLEDVLRSFALIIAM